MACVKTVRVSTTMASAIGAGYPSAGPAVTPRFLATGLNVSSDIWLSFGSCSLLICIGVRIIYWDSSKISESVCFWASSARVLLLSCCQHLLLQCLSYLATTELCYLCIECSVCNICTTSLIDVGYRGRFLRGSPSPGQLVVSARSISPLPPM